MTITQASHRARPLAYRRACPLDHLGMLSAFGEQIERFNAR
jgi:hypothetical protein